MRRKGWFLSRSAPPERRQAATAQRLTARHTADKFTRSATAMGDFCPRDRSSGQRRRAPHSADPDGFPPFTNATSSQLEWQTPVVGPDGDPGPPECAGYVTPRPQAPHPVPLQDASRSAPREPYGRRIVLLAILSVKNRKKYLALPSLFVTPSRAPG